MNSSEYRQKALQGLKETPFQRQIIQVAKGLGLLCYHTYDSRRSEPGFPDLVIVGSRTIFRELKTMTGRVTKEQKLWLERLNASGQDAKVWRPSDLADGTIQRELTNLRRFRD